MGKDVASEDSGEASRNQILHDVNFDFH